MLVLASFLALLVLGVAGCATDFARILLAKSARQSAAQSAALAAVLEMDGTAGGLLRARQAAARYGSVQVEFSGHPEGRPELSGTVRVTATAAVPLMVMRAVLGGSSANVWATAAATQRPKEIFTEGLFPYSPLAHSDARPHFGLEPGSVYSLRWAAQPTLAAGNVCPGDRAQTRIDLVRAENFAPSGFIETGTPGSIRRSILSDYQTAARAIGDRIRMSSGDRNLEIRYIIERIGQDTDFSAPTYDVYVARGAGNGRRIVASPIHSPHPGMKILGIGAFFLLPLDQYWDQGDPPFCAEYIGPYLLGSRWKAAAESGYYIAALLP